MESTYKPFMVCAANRHMDTGIIVCAPRHFDSIMRAIMNESGGFPHWLRCDQGFVDQRGKFYTREEACIIARENGQIVKKHGPDDELFSEDLY